MDNSDPTESIRRAMIPNMPAELQKWVEAGKKVYTTEEMSAEFEVIGFMAPFICVKEKSTGKLGSMQFTHNPRYYFDWKED